MGGVFVLLPAERKHSSGVGVWFSEPSLEKGTVGWSLWCNIGPNNNKMTLSQITAGFSSSSTDAHWGRSQADN